MLKWLNVLLDRPLSGFKIRLEGAHSREAGAWTDPPDEEDPLPDAHFRIALGMRMNIRHPLPGSLPLCQDCHCNILGLLYRLRKV